jgi:hypothetical protein
MSVSRWRAATITNAAVIHAPQRAVAEGAVEHRTRLLKGDPVESVWWRSTLPP